MGLKRIVRRLLGYQVKTNLPVDSYKQSGNLVHGTNCKLESLSISIQDAEKDFLNIQIGNDCYLACSIILNSPHAKIIIGDGVFIGPNTMLFCYENISFENDIMVSWGCTFIDTNSHSLNSSERSSDVRDWIKGPQYKNWNHVKHSPILIQNKCWIGFNSIISKGVSLGEGTVIASGSVVTKSTEAYSVYGGNPASFIKKTL